MYLSDCVERIEGKIGFKRLLPKLLDANELSFSVIIATHFHRDHYDLDSVPIIVSNGAKLFASEDCKDDVQRQGLDYYSPIFVKPGDEYTIGDFNLKFVDCDHGANAPMAIGVIVKVDGYSIYEAGDTCLRLDRIPTLKREGPFSAVIGPINGAYGNMNATEFARFGHELGGVLIPCHYGMFSSHGGNPGLFYNEMVNKYPNDSFLIMSQGEQYTFN